MKMSKAERKAAEETLEVLYESIKNNKEVFGNAVRLSRKMKGLTQSQIAKKVGVDVSQISRYEHGETIPTKNNFYKLLKVL